MTSTKDKIHQRIVAHLDEVEKWFAHESQGLFFPFYSSFDVRDSGEKIVPVDANIFPAGFNNICPTDQEAAVELVEKYFKSHYASYKKVILLTEEHTHNPYYWDNVSTLQKLLDEAGLEVRLAIPRQLAEPLKLTSASGVQVTVHSAERVGGKVQAGGMTADLVISNNDFSEAYREWVNGLETPINPPHELGWHRRRKDEFFREYNQLAVQFCKLVGLEPWLLSVHTEAFTEFDINDEQSREQLAQRVDQVLSKLQADYKTQGLVTEPFVFIKNNSGTYGLGVTQVNSGDEVRKWNYNSRKKMKAAKGGGGIEQVIIQEGVPTVVTAQGATAEPTIYMIGCRLAGGFLRTHEAKGPRESLNSPGAVYRRLCVSDLNISVEGHPMENVYGWVARLSFLAIAREAKNHRISCPCFASSAQV
ncbi:MAG: glutamate--cysteine ligase [Bdellovibrionales bacterium]